MNASTGRIGFTRWLKRQTDRQDAVGELGRFVVSDRGSWKASKYRSVAIHHLRERHGAGEEMVQAVFEAWRELREFKRSGYPPKNPLSGRTVAVLPHHDAEASGVSSGTVSGQNLIHRLLQPLEPA